VTSEARRRGARKHADRSWTCPCGRTVWGNGGKSSHKRACPVYQELFPKPVSDLELRRRAIAGDAPRDSSDPWALVETPDELAALARARADEAWGKPDVTWTLILDPEGGPDA